MGDGAVAQGAFHESVNLAALWNLPCIFVIENNLWGMGTAVKKAISVEKMAEKKAPGYGISGYTFDGMDYFNCYAGFKHVYEEVLKTSRPVLIEVITERFKGHSVSDPGLYRSKEQLKLSMQRDPIAFMLQNLIQSNMIDEAAYKKLDKEIIEIVVESMKYAESCEWPDPKTLEQDVYAP